jgi:hypothetical protein
MNFANYVTGWQQDGLSIRTASGQQVAIVKHEREVPAAIEQYKAETEKRAATIARMKSEILAHIASGRVPATVASFSELHDYVDANCYGGFCDDEQSSRILELQDERDSLTEEQERNWSKAGELDELQEEFTHFVNQTQNAIDAWLKAGGHNRPVPDFSGLRPDLAKAATYRAAQMWCYVTTDGRAFYVTEDEANKMQERSGGTVYPPL